MEPPKEAPESLSCGLHRSLPLFSQILPNKNAPAARLCRRGFLSSAAHTTNGTDIKTKLPLHTQKARQVSLPGFGVYAYFATLVR